ncbi:MAG: TolC family protein [Epsilonproteobacteria bacterium]|nr:MAG: TolC family protein [Campylobacterota bacterium]
MKNKFKILSTILLLNISILNASNSISLDDAIQMLKEDNLEIKGATLHVNAAREEAKTVSGQHWGTLNFIQDFANSDDAGNVFGFKLTSREADFGDFGAEEFMGNFMAGDPDYDTPPNKLNNPGSRDFFQSKLKYEIPIFTGFKISSYEDMMNAMTKMKSLEKEQIINEKIYQVRKTFYDMALLRSSEENLNIILTNIDTLQEMTSNMIEVGYAKRVDLLEVKAKRGNVRRLISQMESNQKLLYHYLTFLLNKPITDIQTPSANVAMPIYSDSEILESNLDIQRANNGLEIRKSMLDISQAAYYPMVGGFAETATADNTFLGDANDHSSYTVGARLTWNIFNGGIDGSSIEKSRLDFMKTQTQVQLAKSGIKLQIAKIRTEIETFENDIISLEEEFDLANEIYKNYEGRYREKLSSMSDVIIKQSVQIEKILQLQQARNKRNEKIFALEKLANGEI